MAWIRGGEFSMAGEGGCLKEESELWLCVSVIRSCLLAPGSLGSFLVIRVLGSQQEMLAHAVHLHVLNMICAVRQLAELGADVHRILGIVQVRGDIQALDRLCLLVKDQ